MKFDAFSGNRRVRRQSRPTAAPAMIESLESRALLAAPQVVSPTGTISTVRPTITWEAVDNAVSYDVWVSDVETREVLFVRNGLASTSLVAPEDLQLGRNRIWAQANFADGTSTGWGTPTDVTLRVTPTITGPVNTIQVDTPFKLNETKPTITWTSPSGAKTFEIFFSNQTEQTSVTYRVQNLQPVLDGDGKPIPDGQGGVVLQETRSLELPQPLPFGQYRVFMRTIDDAGQTTAWTAPYSFEVVPAVEILRPSAPSFQNPPLLQWKAVPNATHYELFVAKVGAEQTPIYNIKYLTTTSWQLPKALSTTDEYVFWVRARRLNQVTEINIKGAPTSGTYRVSLTTQGTTPKTVQTGLIPFDADENQLRAAIRALPGFESANVITTGTAPLYTHLIQIPQISNPVKVVVTGTITGGTLSSGTRTSPEVIGLWSARSPFSTIRTPVITAPVGIGTNNPAVRTVTDVRPTLEWTAIDRAARYEIWVDRTASTSTYLKTVSTTNSYTFETDIAAGNYWVWVRAISTTGQATPWSQPYKFTATGGAPLILTPTALQTVTSLPTFTWTAVPDAVSYEIHLAWLNVDFDYIQATGITQTSFTPNDPLNPGAYRLWVRAIKADGTALNWSTQVSFFVVGSENPAVEDPSADNADELLAVLQLPLGNHSTPAPETAEKSAVRSPEITETPAESTPAEAIASSEPAAAHSASALPVVPEQQTPSVEWIERLAELCSDQEWWTAPVA